MSTKLIEAVRNMYRPAPIWRRPHRAPQELSEDLIQERVLHALERFQPVVLTQHLAKKTPTGMRAFPQGKYVLFSDLIDGLVRCTRLSVHPLSPGSSDYTLKDDPRGQLLHRPEVMKLIG